MWLCVGVKNADENELKAIASEPEDTHVYNVADFSIMSTIVDGLTSKVCDGVAQQDKDIKRECFNCYLNLDTLSDVWSNASWFPHDWQEILPLKRWLLHPGTWSLLRWLHTVFVCPGLMRLAVWKNIGWFTIHPEQIFWKRWPMLFHNFQICYSTISYATKYPKPST